MLLRAQEEGDKIHFGHEAPLAAALARLDGHAERLALMKDRFAIAAGLVGRRVVRLRNEAAAVAASKRAWDQERQHKELNAVREAVTSLSTVSVAAAGSSSDPRGASSPKRSAVKKLAKQIGVISASQTATVPGLRGLRPDCETVMRAAFRRLDSQGTGTVDAARWAQTPYSCVNSTLTFILLPTQPFQAAGDRRCRQHSPVIDGTLGRS